MNYDDEAFENMPDDGEEPVSDITEPYNPLPLLFDDYKWPKPLDEILTFAETKHQRDALFLGMVDAIGSTGIAQNVIDFDGRGIIIETEADTYDIIPSREVGITYEDFEACLSMAEPLYLHATHIISFINSIEVKNRNISDRERLLDMMDDKFSRNQWAETANDMGVPLNTADSWLRRLVKSGVVVKGEERGMYIKVSYI